MIFSKLWNQLRNKPFREAYVEAQAKRAIPFQVRAIMERRGISQTELAERSGLTQGVISRAANPAYGNLTLNTIIRVAAGLDMAFVGTFVPFSKLVNHFEHLDSPELSSVSTFEEEDQLVVSGEVAQASDEDTTPSDLPIDNFKMAKAGLRLGDVIDDSSAVSHLSQEDTVVAPLSDAA